MTNTSKALIEYNRLYQSANPFQGSRKKVLCVCSAGLLRSPTIAWVLSNDPYGFNTRSAGVHEYALVPIDGVLVKWADEIVFAEQEVKDMFDARNDLKIAVDSDKKLVVLNVPDIFCFREDPLVDAIKEQYDAYQVRDIHPDKTNQSVVGPSGGNDLSVNG